MSEETATNALRIFGSRDEDGCGGMHGVCLAPGLEKYLACMLFVEITSRPDEFEEVFDLHE